MAYYNNDIIYNDNYNYNDNQIYNTIININNNWNDNECFSIQEIENSIIEHANYIIEQIRINCIQYYIQYHNIQTLDDLIDDIIFSFPMIQMDNMEHFRILLTQEQRRLSETQQMFIIHQNRIRFLESYLLNHSLNRLQIILNIRNDLDRETNI